MTTTHLNSTYHSCLCLVPVKLVKINLGIGDFCKTATQLLYNLADTLNMIIMRVHSMINDQLFEVKASLKAPL